MPTDANGFVKYCLKNKLFFAYVFVQFFILNMEYLEKKKKSWNNLIIP